MSRHGLVVATLLLVVGGLLAWPAGTASAAGPEDGPEDGLTDSAMTLAGKAADNGDDFSSLRVTVDQTKGLVNQTVRVSWTGGAATTTNFYTNYLQLMQCWGPDPDAADFAETCQFGAGLPTPRGTSTNAATRVLADVTKAVPFRSVAGKRVDGSTGVLEFFGVQLTNEVPWALTSSAGTGGVDVELQTAKEAPHLGCGGATATGVRPCWLVVVPRGEHRADGTRIDGLYDPLGDGPFPAANWSARLAFPLEFEPVAGACPAGRAERLTGGSEMAGEAMGSWQSVLCQTGDVTYGYASIPDAVGRLQTLEGRSGGAGLAFTQRPAVSAGGGPRVVHAPALTTGAVIAFSIEKQIDDRASPEARATNGQQVTELELTPRLVAKLLTQSYRADVPDGNNQPHVKDNPRSLRDDKEFLDLNPEFVAFTARARPGGLLVAGQSADAAYEVWRWIRADPAAREWLAGEPDDQGPGKPGMVVNPKYTILGLDRDPNVDSYPKIDDSTAASACAVDASGCYPFGTLDAFPYLSDMRTAALQTLRADNRAKTQWDKDRTPQAYKSNGPQTTGERWSMSITDAASAARYGLNTASLLNQAGEFVAPTTPSLQAGVTTMRPSPDQPEVLATEPAAKTAAAYPLTMVTYAAVNVDAQDATARAQYADLIRYAVGPGQVPGVKRGELPPGYAPLPSALVAQARAAADAIETYVAPPAPVPTPRVRAAVSPAPVAPRSTADTDDSTGTGNGTGSDDVDPPADEAPVETADAAASGPVITDADAKAVARTTPATPVGAARYVLLAAMGIGLAAAVAGPLALRRARRAG